MICLDEKSMYDCPPRLSEHQSWTQFDIGMLPQLCRSIYALDLELIIPGIGHFSSKKGGKLDIKKCDWHKTPCTIPFPGVVYLGYEICWTLGHFRSNLQSPIYVNISPFPLFVFVFDLFCLKMALNGMFRCKIYVRFTSQAFWTPIMNPIWYWNASAAM